MATEQQIREGLRSIAKSLAPEVSIIATVKSIDESKATCILVDEDDQEYFDVRLRPVLTNKKSFYQLPKEKAIVLAVRIEDNDNWMIIACDEVDKFYWTTGNTTIEASDKIHLEANGQSLIDLLFKLFSVIEKGYTTNTGATIKLVMQPEFEQMKNEFKQLLK